MNSTLQKLHDTMIDYDQFKKSKLHECIMNVMRCSFDTAFDLGKAHCNNVSTWGIAHSLGFEMEYDEFFSFEMLHKLKSGEMYCNGKGYMYIGKQKLLDELKTGIQIIQYPSIPDSIAPGDLFQVSINGNHHFIASGADDDLSVMLFDTHENYRGPYGGEISQAFEHHNDKADWYKHFKIK